MPTNHLYDTWIQQIRELRQLHRFETLYCWCTGFTKAVRCI